MEGFYSFLKAIAFLISHYFTKIPSKLLAHLDFFLYGSSPLACILLTLHPFKFFYDLDTPLHFS